ncbi:hypothetical protein NPIL_448941 [Nephila pilipes]|uniref:Uncharacterized protein n=1 Tax=Nephila pilipes TaxID=299642 RepID=A0A8X6MZF8_NEPPI|nr:hypothetical protein NPIL_698561 [Nephila pilipes]GFU15275.1 hypothetical protein NPIL_448941 [Nephila pilipes]
MSLDQGNPRRECDGCGMGWSDESRTCRPGGSKEVPSQVCEVSEVRSEAPSVSRGVYLWLRLLSLPTGTLGTRRP